MTAPAPLDLEALAAAVEAITPGEWFERNAGVRVTLPTGEIKLADCPVALYAPSHPQHAGGYADARGIVALRNAAPALVRVARAAAAYVEACREADAVRTSAEAERMMGVTQAAWGALMAAFEPGALSGGATKEADRG